MYNICQCMTLLKNAQNILELLKHALLNYHALSFLDSICNLVLPLNSTPLFAKLIAPTRIKNKLSMIFLPPCITSFIDVQVVFMLYFTYLHFLKTRHRLGLVPIASGDFF